MVIRYRSSNIEFYRIIVMLLIVAHHYVVNSGLIEKMQESDMHPESCNHSIFRLDTHVP